MTADTGPDFLLIGAQRSGTTSMVRALQDVPGVVMCPDKECGFFAYEGNRRDFRGPGDYRASRNLVTEHAHYAALFEGAGHPRGEASVVYLYDESAAARIHEWSPDMRLIAILRDPVERAYSAFSLLRSQGREPIDCFRRALEEEDRRVAEGWEPLWHYRRVGMYGQQLARYRSVFPTDQILLIGFEEWVRRPEAVLRRVLDFVGAVSPEPLPRPPHLNASASPRSFGAMRALEHEGGLFDMARRLLPRAIRSRLGTTARRVLLRERAPADEEARSYLGRAYREDRERLKAFGVDTTSWVGN